MWSDDGTGGVTANRVFSFVGGAGGSWNVVRCDAVAGDPLEPVASVEVLDGDQEFLPPGARWILRGAVGHERYATRSEHDLLVSRQPELNRPGATRAALIPIRKSARWWSLAQDERRAIFEERSEHIKTGLRYLPAVARRLHHGRDLGEPFDFLTWFEYAPHDAEAFEELVGLLRRTEEWSFVERDIDIRLVKIPLR